MTKDERRTFLHQIVDDLSVAVAHLELAEKDMKLLEGNTGKGNIRLLVLAERAADHRAALRRLVDDIRKA